MDKYVIEPIRGSHTDFSKYEHVVKMPWYQWREGSDYTTPSDRLIHFSLRCHGDVGFVVVIEEDADDDSPLLISYRMAFSNPDDAILFKLSAPL